jgi:release factor glutamine methyltransferase
VPTIAEALRDARRVIPAVDARMLLRFTLGATAEYLGANPEGKLSAEEHDRYTSLVARRAAGEPVAYLTGTREFYGLDFRVTRDVLIPRPETELLVELAIERVPLDRPSRVVDVGTGSGCIAICIAHHRPLARVTAVDLSDTALEVARDNARHLLHQRQETVDFVQGDLFTRLGRTRFDVIASNPPYVAQHDPHLVQGDLRFEPELALNSGADGLDAIARLVAEAPAHLASGGWLLIEHGYDQSERVQGLFRGSGFTELRTFPDLAGIPRVTVGRLDESVSEPL